jgi:hypothetical protein
MRRRCLSPNLPGSGPGVEITCRVYKPRRPRESPLFRLVEQHLEELLRVWPQRFARTHGPLRPVVERVMREFLTCGFGRTRLRPGLVLDLPDQLPHPLFMSGES